MTSRFPWKRGIPGRQSSYQFCGVSEPQLFIIPWEERSVYADLLPLVWAPHFHISIRVRARVWKIWLWRVIKNVTIIQSIPRGFHKRVFCVFWVGTARNDQRYDSSIFAQTVEPPAALLTGRSGRWHILLTELHNSSSTDRLIEPIPPADRIGLSPYDAFAKFHSQGVS
jgi:hypothetical protein